MSYILMYFSFDNWFYCVHLSLFCEREREREKEMGGGGGGGGGGKSPKLCQVVKLIVCGLVYAEDR